MLSPQVKSLLSVASGPLTSRGSPDLPESRVFAELRELLAARNGFYAFEAALHVFGSGTNVMGRSLEDWNSSASWRASYGGEADGLLFFAEDAFGTQFAIRGEEVLTFDPESADVEVLASGIEDWADQLLGNYEVLTGFPVAHAWQEAHGTLAPGHRLVPKRPFVLGGDFDQANLYALDAVEGMRRRADLASQIKNKADGEAIRYRVVE